MKGVFLFVTLTFFLIELKGQSQILSPKHLNKVNREQNVSKKLALYHRFYKGDSAKLARRCEKRWEAKSDSMTAATLARKKAIRQKLSAAKDGTNTKIYNSIYRPWARKQANRYLDLLDKSGIKTSISFKAILRNYLENHFLEASQNDSELNTLKTQLPDLPLPKALSAKLKNYRILNPDKILAGPELRQFGSIPGLDKLKSNQRGADKYVGQLGKYNRYTKNLSNPDSLRDMMKSDVSELANQYADDAMERVPEIGNLKSHLNEKDKLNGMVGEYRGQMSQLQDSAYIKEQARKKAEELSMKYLSEHPVLIKGIQQKASLLMKKYSIVPNSNDLSTATKRTSLKGKTFFEHLQIAANFQVISLKPLSIDFSPQVGYKINHSLTLGGGALYRKTFRDSIPAAISPDVFGYKVFVNYEVLNRIFVQGEYGRNSPGLERVEGTQKRIWENTLLAGVGRKFNVHPKLQMTIMMGYNFLHAPHDTVYPRPWVVRVGFQTSELAFLNKKKMIANNYHP